MNLYENRVTATNRMDELCKCQTTGAMESPYLPRAVKVEQSWRLTEKERFFRFATDDEALLNYSPGQFYMVGMPGYGEAPISISSGPGSPVIEMCIRAAGSLTNALHRLRRGDTVWLRGPFGRGFDIEEMKGKDIVFIAGGIGIVPMRSLVKAVAGRPGYGRLTLIYGSRSPEEILYHAELEEWKKSGVDVRLTIDKPHPKWDGNVGVVTTLMPSVEMKEGSTLGVIIGPPVMYKFVIMSFREKRLKDSDMLLSLERRMKCGVGKCGHCQINSVYVCQEGPVFRLSELHGLPEAI